jgi:two-component system LytT family response regulator
MIKVILVDDELVCRKILRSILGSLPELKLLAECSSVDEAKAAIQQESPDLVFLDVEMPLKNGFDLLHELSDISFSVVFTTAYDRYAVRAIKASALDFLLKPVTREDVVAAVERFRQRAGSNTINKQVDLAVQFLSNLSSQENKIAVPGINGLEFIKLCDIIHIEASGNYSEIHLLSKEKLLALKPLKELEDILAGQQFLRIHHSHLINLKYIKRYQKADGGTVIMDDGAELSISRPRKEDFLKALKM